MTLIGRQTTHLLHVSDFTHNLPRILALGGGHRISHSLSHAVFMVVDLSLKCTLHAPARPVPREEEGEKSSGRPETPAQQHTSSWPGRPPP